MDIGSGYVVAVDPTSLRVAAAHAQAVADEVAAAAAAATGAGMQAPFLADQPAALAQRITALKAEIENLITGLRFAADLYEAADAAWRVDFYGAGSVEGRAAGDVLDRLTDRYAGKDRDAVGMARTLLEQRDREFDDEVEANLELGLGDLAWLAPVISAFPAAGAYLSAELAKRDRGVLPRGSFLLPDTRGELISVQSTAPRANDDPAPRGLADIAGRIPENELVRVDSYTFPDGHVEHAVYVRGTQDMLQDGHFDILPFPETSHVAADMESNLEIYLGVEGEAYRAVEEAMTKAGVKPGDIVYGAGHSQGGMILENMAAHGDYRFDTLVSFASPQQADLGDTLHVTLRQADDLVASMQGAGIPGAAGAPGSVAITDTYEPGGVLGGGYGQIGEPHMLSHYRALAAEADASQDPRMDGIRDRLAHLSEAVKVETSTATATRVQPGE